MDAREPAGQITITIEEPTEAAALTAALGRLLAVRRASGDPLSGSGRYVPIRAEARDLSLVLPALFEAMIEQMESHGQEIGAVEIAGLVRSDDGCVAWGMAELAAGSAPQAIRAVRFPAPPSVVTALSGVSITITLDRRREPVR